MTALPATLAMRGGVGLTARAVVNETAKSLLVAWSHGATLLPQLVLAMVLYWIA